MKNILEQKDIWLLWGPNVFLLSVTIKPFLRYLLSLISFSNLSNSGV
ncbi:hypothetical protein NI447_01705 [Enterococcus lactis]|nr:hypothetical protein [Enterococcus lactis]